MTSRRIAGPLLAGVLIAQTVFVISASATDKQTFAGREAMYVLIEITENDSKTFGTVAPDSLSDAAYRHKRSVRFEVPLNMAMPDSCPMSTITATPNAVLEPGRCIGWMAAPPDDPATEEMLTTGKIDMSKSAMFLPVEFSIDDVDQFRYRDTPSDGFATNTTTTKGKGIAYIALSGMLMCDLTKMTCDVNNLVLSYQNATDLLTVSTTSDVPGFEGKVEKVGPALKIPGVPKELASQLTGFAIKLPEPIIKELTGSATVKVKVTLSSVKPSSR